MEDPSAAGRADPVDAVVTTARALVGMAVRSLAASPVELTVPQHRTLVLLAGGEALSIGRLAEELGVNASNASRLCDRLERLGLVARRRSDADGRSVQVGLTATGRDVLRTVDAWRRREVAHVLADMSEDDAAATVRALGAFAAAAHERTGADWERAAW